MSTEKPAVLTYIVQSHLGGTYLSQADPELIEAFCEQCGDCDCILAAFRANDPEIALMALVNTYTADIRREIAACAFDEEPDQDFAVWTRETIDDLCSSDYLASYVHMLDTPTASLLPPAARERFLAQGPELKADLTRLLDHALASAGCRRRGE